MKIIETTSPIGDHARHRRPEGRPGENHRRDAERRCHRCEKDGTQSTPAGEKRRCLDVDAASPQLVRVVDQNDRVPNDNARERVEPEVRGVRERIPCDHEPERRADDRQRNRRHDHQRMAHCAELE